MIRNPKSSEESLHLAVVQLLKLCAPRDVLWFHPANEAKRSPRTGAQLKRMGMLPGVADFTIILPGGRACFLELKTKTGRQSPEQKAFQLAAEACGAPYAIARDFEEAKAILASWGALRGIERRAA